MVYLNLKKCQHSLGTAVIIVTENYFKIFEPYYNFELPLGTRGFYFWTKDEESTSDVSSNCFSN